MRNRDIFGLRISPRTAAEIAAMVVENTPPGGEVGLIVTPNIQHVALLHDNAAFRGAYDRAAAIVCDGFPVYYYARLRGVDSPGRVTGCDIAMDIMGRRSFAAHHRFFFVVDTEETAEALHLWAAERGMEDRVATAVPEFGFEKDPAYTAALAETIRAQGATILFMGLGAPKSEIFIDSHRHLLPPCWAMCVGQAVKMALGLTPTPPNLLKILNLEWLWRLGLEPRRMSARYRHSIAGFAAAIFQDLGWSK